MQTDSYSEVGEQYLFSDKILNLLVLLVAFVLSALLLKVR